MSATNTPMWSALEQRVAPEHGQLRLVGDVRGRRHRVRLRRLKRPADPEEVRRGPDDDPVEHDRRDHLVGAHCSLEEACDSRDERAGEHPPDDRRDHEEHPRQVDDVRKLRGDEDRNGRAGDVLTLSSDVEEAAAERERDREPHQHERRPENAASAGGSPPRETRRRPRSTGTRPARRTTGARCCYSRSRRTTRGLSRGRSRGRSRACRPGPSSSGGRRSR